ncbi:MAG: NADAR family protein [archaeon]
MINNFKGKYWFLSNYSNYGFKYKGIYYKTNEHFFNAMKTLDKQERKKIINAKTPGEAKKLGRQCTLRENWDKGLRDKVMIKGLTLKFEQNKSIKEKLIATGDEKLVEGNTWHDNYWGACKCNKCKNEKKENKLGKSLMKIRKLYI